jgi:hypothetical protein
MASHYQDQPLTFDELEADLRELERRGLIARGPVPDDGDTIVYPERAERLLTDGDERRLNRLAVQDKLIRAIDQLGDAMAEYAVASAILVEATEAARGAQVAYDEARVEITDSLYQTGKVAGSNDKTREANLRVQLLDHRGLQELAVALDKANAAQRQAEHQFRVCDMSQKNLREIVRGLGAALDN